MFTCYIYETYLIKVFYRAFYADFFNKTILPITIITCLYISEKNIKTGDKMKFLKQLRLFLISVPEREWSKNRKYRKLNIL